ncbi:hypothetical protein AVEN_94332-1 [Araneus ventricosus]|uniref:Uncharacterized protein n=1 Tax=Araneus ventricosus TaxID=182803 RepID=A0A4Y2E9Y1_ARAVE|nr:hypothetical protein AVEN_94332-1 [Araneus ventricosus]
MDEPPLPNGNTSEVVIQPQYSFFGTELLLIIQLLWGIAESYLHVLRVALIRTLTMKLLIWVATNSKGSFQFSLVILMSRFETTQGLFWGGTRNFELSQMTRTIPELVPLSPNFRIIPAGECLTHDVRFNMHHAHIHDGSSVK